MPYNRTPLNQHALSSDRAIVLQAHLVRLQTFLGIFIKQFSNAEHSVSEHDLEQTLLALSDTFDVFYNRGTHEPK